MTQHRMFHAPIRNASLMNLLPDGESIGILNRATPAKAASSKTVHPNAVQKPSIRREDDQVGSINVMKYGAMMSHTLTILY